MSCSRSRPQEKNSRSRSRLKTRRLRNPSYQCWISEFQLRIFRVPDPGKSSGCMRIWIQPIPVLLLIKYGYLYLEITKNTLNSIIKKNLPIICHFIFHTTVLQYTKSRIHRPKVRNKIFNSLLFQFLLDPDPEQYFWIRIQ